MTVLVPLVLCEPVQAPLAVQLFALVVDHVSVALCVRLMVEGLTEIVTVGCFTVRVTLLVPLPHVRV
ncbi:MAG TPA: hypothetical protein VFB04_10935 [Terriglobales bacterium]|nr:hypothetical protein [Terriglobales bacterium]